jgi:uncharacterized membrane protein YraQ (UPF0718 family)/copper chaperone CopZ
MEILARYFRELWQIGADLSLPLLLGLFLAGLLHVFLPQGFLRRHLSRPDIRSVFRAALVGVPIPLCSCGVVPTAIGLRNAGASRGATTAFLISTPQTGVDSILVSAALLGWPFAIFKLIAAFVTGLLGGAMVNAVQSSAPRPNAAPENMAEEPPKGQNRFAKAFRYAVFDLLAAIDLWILVGVLIAAAISLAFPTDYLSEIAWTQGFWGMLLVLSVALPLYVCTTGSVPVAASLIVAGMPAGSALVFLMAGPATNVATIGAVYRSLGWKVLLLYVGTVVVMSIGFGLTFDFILPDARGGIAATHQAVNWLDLLATALLLGLLLLLLARRLARRFVGRRAVEQTSPGTLMLKVDGMRCGHCVSNVKRALEAFDGVEEATPDLGTGLVQIRGARLHVYGLSRAVEQAGYKVAGSS